MKLNATKIIGRQNEKGYFVCLIINGRKVYDQDIIALIINALELVDVIGCIEEETPFDVYI